MRRRKFPRFAPESLERKLNPSGIVPAPVAAEVYIPVTQTVDTIQVTSTFVSLDQTDLVSPVTAFVSIDPITTDTVTADPVPGVPTEPGDPEPVDPEIPTDGTGPAPPPSDGTPPYDPPSIPGGPDLPALV